MATILESLRRRVKSYGDRRALGAFRMPEGYSGGIPGAAEVLAPAGMGGASKAALSAGERVLSALRARGQGKAMSESPTAKNKKLQAVPAAAAAATAALKTGGVNQLFQGGNTRQDFSLGVRNNLTSNFALQSVNARYQGASGLTGGGTAPLRAASALTGGGTAMLGAASQNGALQASFRGAVAAMGAVSGDGSAYRDLAAASPGAAGANAVVQVEMVNHNAVSSELDLDRVVSYLADKVAEGLQTAAETVHW